MKVTKSKKIPIANEGRGHVISFTTVPKPKGQTTSEPCLSRSTPSEIVRINTRSLTGKGKVGPSLYIDTITAAELQHCCREVETVTLKKSTPPSIPPLSFPVAPTAIKYYVESTEGSDLLNSERFCVISKTSPSSSSTSESRQLVSKISGSSDTKDVSVKVEVASPNLKSAIQNLIATDTQNQVGVQGNSTILELSGDVSSSSTCGTSILTLPLPLASFSSITGRLNSSTRAVTMRGKGNRNSSASTPSVTPAASASASSHQLSSGGTQPALPRTPGTPSEAGALTPNPPTPGNNNSNSMVSSPAQYVAITVEADATSGNDNGLSGGNSYVTYVEGSTDHATLFTTANGQNMSYPMYTVGESGTVYGSGSNSSSHYFSGSSNNGVSYTQEGGVFLVQSPSANNNNNSLTIDITGGGTANINNRVSPATKRKKNVPELCPIPTSSQRTRPPVTISRHEFYDEDTMDDDIEEVDESYPNASGSGGIMSELERLGFDLHGTPLDHANNSLGSDDPLMMCFPAVPSGSVRASPATVQWLLENYETAEGVSLPRSTLYNHYLRHCTDHKLDPVNAASFGKLIRSVFLGLRTRRLGTRGNSKYHYYGIRLKPDSPLNHVKEEIFTLSGNYTSNGHHASAGVARGIGHHNFGSTPAKRFKPSTRNDLGDGNSSNGLVLGDTSAFVQYLGDPSEALDNFLELEADGESYPEGVVENDLFMFRTLYREHCKTLLEALANFQLTQFELNWRMFWRGGDEETEFPENSVNLEKILPKSKMLLVCKMNAVQNFVKKVDYGFYQHIVEILLPDVLRPIPSAMTQAIRNFAKGLENWLSVSMTGYPDTILAIRVSAVNALAQTLRRYTSLNHLAQAARAVLQNQNQISQMLSDLNRVDFRNVEEQASWVCGCAGDVVPSIEQDFKATLGQQQTLDQWAAWLEKIVDKMLKPYENKPNFVHSARHFLLKWSFYSSLIIRDLTLRSAASFGSFHLLRLLYDEYIFYLIENRVAKATGMVPIEVIGKKNSAIESSSDESLRTEETGRNGEKSLPNGNSANNSNSNSAASQPTPAAVIKVETSTKRVKNFLT